MSDPRLEEIKKGLNPGQMAAATAEDSSIIVIAGAGCGKTKTSVHRIAYYIHSGVNPENILAMTFSNKAAKETFDRVRAFIPDAKGINSYTYHSFALREIIQEFSKHPFFQKMGFTRNINIIDEKDSDSLLREARKKLPSFTEIKDAIGIKDKKVDSALTYHRAKGLRATDYLRQLAKETVTLADNSVATLPELWKQLEVLLPRITKAGGEDPAAIQAVQKAFEKYPSLTNVYIAKLWREYERECIRNNGIDFDDVLTLSARLLQSAPEVLAQVGDKFTHFVLDEFQDSNSVQFSIVKTLFDYRQSVTSRPPNFFVVADTRQAIFSFRGSDSRYMKSLKDLYPSAVVKTLDINYRSSDAILDAANLHAKTMKGHLSDGHLDAGGNKSGPVPKLELFEDFQDEARFIADDIRSKISQGVEPSDIAVLYRTSAVKSGLEQELASSSIPYHVIGDLSFFDSKEISDLVAFMRAISRPYDHLATSRVVGLLPGLTGMWYRANVGAHTNTGYFNEMCSKGTSKGSNFKPIAALFNAVDQVKKSLSLREAVINFVREQASDATASDANIIYSVEKMLENGELDLELLASIKDTVSESHGILRSAWYEFYKDLLINHVRGKKGEGLTEQEQAKLDKCYGNMKMLFDDMLNRLISDMQLDFDTCVDDIILASDTSEADDVSKVQFLTLHKSKGLEYQHVYVMGADDEIFFKEQEPDSDKIEDEANLFYVGLTRAMESLHVTCSSTKLINGEVKANYTPLRFLTDDLLMKFSVTDCSNSRSNSNGDARDNSAAYEQCGAINQMSIEDIASVFNL